MIVYQKKTKVQKTTTQQGEHIKKKLFLKEIFYPFDIHRNNAQKTPQIGRKRNMNVEKFQTVVMIRITLCILSLFKRFVIR